MIFWMYFQARHYCCVESLKMEPRVETATQEVFNSFFYHSPCALAGTNPQMDCIQATNRHSPARTRPILQFSCGLICTEQFPAQLAVLNALSFPWKSSFSLSVDQDNHVFVLGNVYNHFVFLICDECFIDSGVMKTSIDLWRSREILWDKGSQLPM